MCRSMNDNRSDYDYEHEHEHEFTARRLFSSIRNPQSAFRNGMTPFSDFYVPLRTLLGDTDPYQVYDRQDDELDGAIRSVFLLGRSPFVNGSTTPAYALSGDRQTADEIDPDIPNGDDFALIAYEAALLLVGGENQQSYRTRGLSVTNTNAPRRNLISELKLKIYEIKGGAECFATSQSFIVWLMNVASLPEAVLEVTPAPVVPTTALNINIGQY